MIEAMDAILPSAETVKSACEIVGKAFETLGNIVRPWRWGRFFESDED